MEGDIIDVPAAVIQLSTVKQQLETHGQQIDYLSQQLQTALTFIQQVPALITQAKNAATTAAITRLLGGDVASSLDTLKELGDMEVSQGNILQALTLRVGVVESQAATLNKQLNETGTGLVEVVASTKSAALTASGTAGTALAEANKRLLRTGDTATGPVYVPTAVAMEQAVRLGDLAGGLRRPYKIWISPGATPVPPDTNSSGGPAITNPFPVPLAFAFRAILIRNVSASSLAVTVQVFKSADLVNPIYKQIVPALQVPALGKVADLLSVFATATPADLALPSSLLVSCSVPGFEVEINGVLKTP